MATGKAAIKGPINFLLESSEEAGLKLKSHLPIDNLFARLLVDSIFFPSDMRKVLFQYRRVFGHFPNIFNAGTFNEFLQSDKIFGRKSIKTICADKIAVRSFVAQRIGDRYLNDIYWSGKDLRALDHETLPLSFVVKANNGSGTNIFVKNKREIDWDVLFMMSARWLQKDRSQQHAEWQYRWIDPKILVEKSLVDTGGSPPFDYKFFCFNGRCEIAQVDFDRFKDHSQSFYDRNKLPLNLEYSAPRKTENFELPGCWEEMVEKAEVLAAGFRFVRVDFYVLERPIFGEMTFHPMAGLRRFSPPDWDERLGALLRQ